MFCVVAVKCSRLQVPVQIFFSNRAYSWCVYVVLILISLLAILNQFYILSFALSENITNTKPESNRTVLIDNSTVQTPPPNINGTEPGALSQEEFFARDTGIQ
jgi:hypothetical protein